MAKHDELAVFLGDWQADGTSYGGDEQSLDNPRAGASPWTSIHSARWHSGNYFIVQDERANGPFDTLSVMGWDAEAGRYSRAPSRTTASPVTTPSPSTAARGP